jgi:hypothetical protein
VSRLNDRIADQLRHMRSTNSMPQAQQPRSGQRLVSFYDSNRRRTSEGVDQISIREAGEYNVSGPVIANVVYVTHPVDEKRLIPFADFDETLARDRLDEALRVFTALGASRVVATANRLDVARSSAGMGRRRGGLTVSVGRGSSWQLAVDQRGNGGTPIDPRPLRYSDISGLESACDVVLRNGGSHFKIEIESKAQFGVDGELAAKLKKSGFTVSLSADRTRHNQFIIEAVFGKDAAAKLDAVVAAVLPDPLAEASRFANWRKRRDQRS